MELRIEIWVMISLKYIFPDLWNITHNNVIDARCHLSLLPN